MRDIVIERITMVMGKNLARINQEFLLEMTSLDEMKTLSDEDLLEMYDVALTMV